jgi:ABC-type transport system involved in multi-copper enzyme maturation permease subunit
MLALIRKDLLLHKTAFYAFATVMLIFLVWYARQGDSQNAFVTFACIYAAIMPMVIIAREDKFKTEAFVCSLPVTRREIAQAKYLVSWGIAFTFAVVALVIYSIFGAGRPTDVWSISTAGRILLTLTVSLSIMLPFLLRFGWMGLIVGLVGVQVLGIVTLLLFRTFNINFRFGDAFRSVSDFMASLNAQLGAPLFLLLAAMFLLFCNLASCRIGIALYEQREF